MNQPHKVASVEEAMQLAIQLANRVKGSTYPNPPVGAVIIDPEGVVIGLGATQPAGGDHAEVVALRQAGGQAAGALAVVTMEPCNHFGKTPPCVNALIDARIGTVIFGINDPHGIAGGGAGRLQSSGVQVRSGILGDQVAGGPLREWLHKQRTGLPHVTWKYAASVDGRSAAADGSSRWISGEAARADVHRRRSIADAIVVGIGTVIADDPALTARMPDGSPLARQPLRVVVGQRGIPAGAKVLNTDARTAVLNTHDPREVVKALSEFTDVILEGGPTVAGAFLRASMVNRILAYVAPILLGGPISPLGDIGVPDIAHAQQWQFDGAERHGPDLMLSLVPGPPR